jgi:phenylacetate-CoA ligase
VDPEALYGHLPFPFQNAAASLEGWKVRRRRYGRNFNRLLSEAEQRSKLSQDELVEYRNARLRAFVRHCRDTVPYYTKMFNEHHIDVQSIRTLEDIQAIPLLSKVTVQLHGASFLSTAYPPGRRIAVHTSGTTGAGLKFATTRDAMQEQWAIWWRYRRRHGIEMSAWCGYFGGRSVVPIGQSKPPFWRYNLPGRQVIFSAYHISSDTLPYYVRQLRRRRLPWLHGYPSVLALVASYLIDHKQDLGYTPRWITTGAENLMEQQKSAIERAFGVQPIEHYGMAEAVANFSQCSQGALHIDEDFAAVEFVSGTEDTSPVVVGTNFSNTATPLLRYIVGDVVELGMACTCGLPGRIVKRVDGRYEDYIVLRNGARLGRLDHVFKDMDHIRETQIYQHEAGSIDLRIVRNDGYNEVDERNLLADVRKRVGDETVVQIVYVDCLERTSTGKLRFVVSDLTSGRLLQS